jgi:hypothetical protein
MPKKFVMPEAVGDKHPQYEAVKEALATNANLPPGLSINWGRGAAWLMDAEDARRMEEAQFSASDAANMADDESDIEDA